MRDLELAYKNSYLIFLYLWDFILFFTKTLFVVHMHKRESHFIGNSTNSIAHYSGKIALFSLTIVQNNDILIFVHIMKDDVIYHM